MRSKSTGGGKPKPPKITYFSTKLSSPTTRLKPSYKVTSNAHGSTVLEISDRDDQNTSLKNQIPNTISEMSVEKGSRDNFLDDVHGSKVTTIQGPDSLCSMVPESCEDVDQDTTGDDQNNANEKQNKTVDEMVLEKEACGKVPENVYKTKVWSEIDWSEEDVCIKCNEGGNLLVCSDSNCPLAVHEKCMQCSAHFDNMGRFFCPLCTCKQVMIATYKAKEKAMMAKKALSIFLDRRMLDSGPPDKNADTARNSEQNLPENEAVNNCGTNEQNNVLGRCEDRRRSVDGREEETENIIITEQASKSVGEKNPENVDDVHNKRVLQHDQEADVIGKKRSVDDREEETGNRIVTEQASESVRENVDVVRKKRVLQHDQEDGVMRKKSKLGVEPEMSMEVSLDDPETEKENEEIDEEEQNLQNVDDSQSKKVAPRDQEETVIGKSPKLGVEADKSTDNGKHKEAEKVLQNKEQETSGLLSGEDSLEENDNVASGSFDGNGVLRDSKRTGKKRQDATSSKVERLTRATRKVYIEEDEKEVPKKKNNTINKSRQSTTNTGFPTGKRKRWPWTAEEEEMLKEGVGRFSATAKKNLPWKKILEFGRHVFNGTRTPDNLKDKWRTLQSPK